MTTIGRDMRFKNRSRAGQMLAKALSDNALREDALVLALPRGGVPVGFEIAKALAIPLDVLIVRKLGMPGHEEFAIGAIAGDRKCFLRAEATQLLGIVPEMMEDVVKHELDEIERRERMYRAGKPKPTLRERVVILVDDGLATGSTMQLAVQIVKQELPARLIVAVPVSSADAYQTIATQVDQIVCLSVPPRFHAVGEWYDDFQQTTDDEVIRLLADARSHRRENHTDFNQPVGR